MHTLVTSSKSLKVPSQSQHGDLMSCLTAAGWLRALRSPRLLARTQSELEAQAGALSTQAMRPTPGLAFFGSLVGSQPRQAFFHLAENLQSCQANRPLMCGLSFPWLHAGVKILVDPWLVDELTFAGQRWLYRGKKTHISPVDPEELAKGCDAVILSQV